MSSAAIRYSALRHDRSGSISPFWPRADYFRSTPTSGLFRADRHFAKATGDIPAKKMFLRM